MTTIVQLLLTGVVAAVLAAAISAIVSWRIKISEFRQAWINDLRKDTTDYIGAAERWFRKYDELNDPDVDNATKVVHDQEELFPIANETRVILRRIRLRLNPRADNPDKTKDDAFLKSLDDLLNPGKLDPRQLDSSWDGLAAHAVEQGREILKREWEVTKRGKWFGRPPLSALAQGPIILAIVGLLMTTIGAGWAAVGVVVNKQTATEIASTKWGMSEDLRRSLIRQSRDARNGLILVALGSALQIVGVFAQASRK